jgi:hypothetical protein
MPRPAKSPSRTKTPTRTPASSRKRAASVSTPKSALKSNTSTKAEKTYNTLLPDMTDIWTIIYALILFAVVAYAIQAKLIPAFVFEAGPSCVEYCGETFGVSDKKAFMASPNSFMPWSTYVKLSVSSPSCLFSSGVAESVSCPSS